MIVLFLRIIPNLVEYWRKKTEKWENTKKQQKKKEEKKKIYIYIKNLRKKETMKTKEGKNY